MTTWEERFRRREPPAPRVELLEACWRFVGPSGRPLRCGISRVATGLEMRCAYGDEDIVRTQLIPDLESARELAAEWRRALINKGGFDELSTVPPVT